MRLKSLKAIILSLLLVLVMIGTAGATIKWMNNATSVIADVGGITAGAVSLTVTAGHGDRFPAVSSPHYFMVTLVDASGNREIVKVTARAALSNTMTIVRAQEGTSARAFAAGSLVELRLTKNALDYLSQAADINSNYYVADASAADQGATTNANSIKSLVDTIGATKQATIVLPHTGTGNTTTYTVSTGFTITSNISLVIPKGSLISVAAAQTLTMQGIVQAGAYQIFTGSGTVTVSTYPQDQAWWGSAERLDVTGLKTTTLIVGSTTVTGIVHPIRDISRNLVIRNNASHADHQLDVDADEIITHDASGNALKASAVNLTVDIAASGANGLDTGSASADTWYYVWVISNGTTTAGLLSLSATSPTLPSGYTFKALVGADYYRAGTPDALDTIYQAGNHVSCTKYTNAVVGTQGTPTLVDLAAHVPATAKRIRGTMTVEQASSTEAGAYVMPSTSIALGAVYAYITGATGNIRLDTPFSLTLMTAQTVYYQVSGTGSPQLTLAIYGWEY
jgi:hypothetical protein